MPLPAFYGFQQLPFAKGIAAGDVYPSGGHQELVARLSFALQYRLPALVTGEVGVGKSTSVRAFLSGLDANVYHVAYLPNPHINPQALYQAILAAFHIEPHSTLPSWCRRCRPALRQAQGVALKRWPAEGATPWPIPAHIFWPLTAGRQPGVCGDPTSGAPHR